MLTTLRRLASPPSLARAKWTGGKNVMQAAVGLERRKGERRDSVDDATLHDRAMHELRMSRAPYDKSLLRHIQRLKLGRFKGWHAQKPVAQRMAAMPAEYAERWPAFRDSLATPGRLSRSYRTMQLL